MTVATLIKRAFSWDLLTLSEGQSVFITAWQHAGGHGAGE